MPRQELQYRRDLKNQLLSTTTQLNLQAAESKK